MTTPSRPAGAAPPPDDLRAALATARADPRRRFGRYVVLNELGKGGMGVVYKAWDESLARVVALKLVLAGEGDAEATERFQREAEVVARLRHPCVVGIHEVGAVAGKRFIAMDFVDGASLADRLAPKKEGEKKLAWTKALEIVRDVARAVHHAHEQGIVHRDLKPQNVMVDERGHPFVLDFGIAKLRGDRARLTKTGASMGTPAYMPPEQAEGGEVDERADVYSLGATLYHVLTGRPPFEGESEVNVITALVTKDPVPPGAINPRVALDLETICLKCLEKEPGRRYPSAAAVADELDRFLAGDPIEARPLGFVARLARRARRQKALVALALVALAGASGGVAFGVKQLGLARAAELAAERAREAAFTERQERLVRMYVQRADVAIGEARDREAVFYAQIARKEAAALEERGALAPDLRRTIDLTAHAASWGPWRHDPVPGPLAEKAAFSPASNVAAIVTAGAVELWELGAEGATRRHRGEIAGVRALAWSPDGSSLAIGARDEVQVWLGGDARSVEKGRAVHSVAWSPDGTLLAVGGEEGSLRIHRLSVGSALEVRCHATEIFAIGWHPLFPEVPLVFVASNDWSFSVLQLEGGRVAPLQRSIAHEGGIRALAVSPDGRVATGGADAVIRIWDFERHDRLHVPKLALPGHHGAIHTLVWGAGPLTSAAFDGTVRIWNVAGARSLHVIAPDVPEVHAAGWMAGGRLALVAKGGEVRVCAPTGGPVVLQRAGEAATAVAWGPDGRALAGCFRGDLAATRVFAADGSTVDLGFDRRRSGRTSDELWGVAWLDARTILDVDNGGLGVTWEPVPASPPRERVSGVMLLAAAPEGGVVVLADRGDGREPGPLRVRRADRVEELDRGAYSAIALDRRGRWLAAASTSGSLEVFDLAAATRARLATFAGQVPRSALAIDGEGRWVAVSRGDRIVFCFEREHPERGAITFVAEGSQVQALAFHPRAPLLAVAGVDEHVKLYETASLERREEPRKLVQFRGHGGMIVQLAWTPGGDRLASASHDGTIRTWPVGAALEPFRGDPDDLIERTGLVLREGDLDATPAPRK